jgi:hypothetical protein
MELPDITSTSDDPNNEGLKIIVLLISAAGLIICSNSGYIRETIHGYTRGY